MNKALIVLAECVDIRNGKRFTRGDEFSPAPTHEQARRLVAAGCLPDEALAAAVGPKTDAERALEEKQAGERREAEQQSARAAAVKAAKKTPEQKSKQGKGKPADDGLDAKSVEELKAIAGAEEIDLEGVEDQDIIAAIRAARIAD